MLVIVGAVIVLGCVAGGYLMAGGHFSVLIQPNEFIIILGAAAGSFVIVTTNNKITGVWADGSITLTLDMGNDGTVDRTWTLTRAQFNGEAG